MSERECGGCTVCCTVCEVPELNKAVEVKCKFCDGGCTVYETRPPSCRLFDCYWLTHTEVAEALRPDKCGIMLEQLTTSNTLLAYTDPSLPDQENAWNTPEVVEWLESFAKKGQAVVLKAGKSRRFFVPEGRTPEDVWNDVLNEARSKGLI